MSETDRLRLHDNLQPPSITLREVCTFLSGGTPSKERPEFWGGDIPWVSAKDMKTLVLVDSIDHVTALAIAESSTSVAPVGSVLVLVRGMGLAKGLPVCELARPCAFNQDIRALVPHSRVTPTYLAWAVRSAAARILAKRDTVTHGTLKLDSEMLANTEIPLPPLADQERIAARLTEQLAAVDRARAAAQARLAAAEALPAAYVCEVFEGADWPTDSLSAGLQRIEAGTSVRSLERPAQDGEWGVLKVSAVSWGDFRAHENKAVPPEYSPKQHEEVQAGDLLISRANTAELAGAVVLVREAPRMRMLSDKTLRLVLRSDVFAPEFLEYALRTPMVRKFIERNATGTSYSMRNISQETIRNIPVAHPSVDDQRRLAADLSCRLAKAHCLTTILRDELATIEALPAALLREAFGGGQPQGE